MVNVRRILGLVVPLLLLATTVGAAPTPDAQVKAAERLLQFKVVQGQSLPNGKIDLALQKGLTRAELAVILVKAVGRESLVPGVVTAEPYPDVPTLAWYAPWVTAVKGVATTRGLSLGTAEGNFEPLREVNRAEALVLTLKLLGYRPEGTGAHWYDPWLSLAVKLGVVQGLEADTVLDAPLEPITRGEAFLYLDRILDKPLMDGKVAYDTILDKAPPELRLGWDVPAETQQIEHVLDGTVSDNRGVKAIFVNGVEVGIKLSTTGWFQETIPLAMGKNAIELRVIDKAGNELVKRWEVNRICCYAARFETALFPGFPRTLYPGQRVQLDLRFYDEHDKLLPPTSYRIETDSGTVQDGWFTAGTKAGLGGVMIWAWNMQASVPVDIVAGPPVALAIPTVKAGQEINLQAADRWGNPIMGGFWRAKSTGISVTDDGRFKAPLPGHYFVGVLVPGYMEVTLSIDVTP